MACIIRADRNAYAKDCNWGILFTSSIRICISYKAHILAKVLKSALNSKASCCLLIWSRVRIMLDAEEQAATQQMPKNYYTLKCKHE